VRRVLGPVVLAVGAAGLLVAWLACEALGLGQALPVLVGEVPASGLELAVVQAGALIVSRLLAVFVVPVLAIAAGLDLLVQAGGALMRSGGTPGGGDAKGPTPKPVGSTGGGL